ncbi:MAG: hypothetical protein ABIQ01_09740, partial [Pseudolysinimonas sp.]
PLTILWIVIIVALLVSLPIGIRRRAAGFENPYADRMPLSAYTRGVIERDELEVALRRPSASPQRPAKASGSDSDSERELERVG